MYKVLLIDDEEIIREGIKNSIEWDAYGFTLTGTCANGIDGYEMILDEYPDLVITDIKMPGLDGLSLIERVRQTNLDIEFIILSGYGEFEFAKQAMGLGVQYYLLKPCNEVQIIQVLNKVFIKLREKAERQKLLNINKMAVEKLIPLARKHFFLELLSKKNYVADDISYYRNMFDISEEAVYLISFNICEEDDLGSVNKQIEQVCQKNDIRLLFDIQRGENSAALLVQNLLAEDVDTLEADLSAEFTVIMGRQTEVSISTGSSLAEIGLNFGELLRSMNESAYLDDSSAIRGTDNANVTEEVVALFAQISTALDFNDRHLVAELLSNLYTYAPTEQNMRTIGGSLLLSIVNNKKRIDEETISYMISSYNKLSGVEEMQVFLMDTLLPLCEKDKDGDNGDHVAYKGCVGKIIKLVEQNISNPEMSLKWLAENHLYMNVNYLSKQFLKQTGEKFSSYLNQERINKAKELILNYETDKIYEIAQHIGLGHNPQYFSQIFKKYTGYTPTEYKDMYRK